MDYENILSYYSYNKYLKEIFGCKTYKVVVASGMTCPTRDGRLAGNGCAFCDLRGSSSFFGKKGRGDGVAEQINRRLPEIKARFGASCFLAYFQSYTNTYGDVTELRALFEEALAQPGISGLCIGTRPDCLPDNVLELLEELASKTYVSLELGVQSFEDSTLNWLARGHDRMTSINALERLRKSAPHVHTCVHLIFGSPTDSPNAAQEAALLINDSGAKGAKLHQLMVLENTELAKRWRETQFSAVSIEEYADIVMQFLKYLSPKIYIERLCATASHSAECLAPEWSRGRWKPHNTLREIISKK